MFGRHAPQHQRQPQQPLLDDPSWGVWDNDGDMIFHEQNINNNCYHTNNNGSNSNSQLEALTIRPWRQALHPMPLLPNKTDFDSSAAHGDLHHGHNSTNNPNMFSSLLQLQQQELQQFLQQQQQQQQQQQRQQQQQHSPGDAGLWMEDFALLQQQQQQQQEQQALSSSNECSSSGVFPTLAVPPRNNGSPTIPSTLPLLHKMDPHRQQQQQRQQGPAELSPNGGSGVTTTSRLQRQRRRRLLPKSGLILSKRERRAQMVQLQRQQLDIMARMQYLSQRHSLPTYPQLQQRYQRQQATMDWVLHTGQQKQQQRHELSTIPKPLPSQTSPLSKKRLLVKPNSPSKRPLLAMTDNCFFRDQRLSVPLPQQADTTFQPRQQQPRSPAPTKEVPPENDQTREPEEWSTAPLDNNRSPKPSHQSFVPGTTSVVATTPWKAMDLSTLSAFDLSSEGGQAYQQAVQKQQQQQQQQQAPQWLLQSSTSSSRGIQEPKRVTMGPTRLVG